MLAHDVALAFIENLIDCILHVRQFLNQSRIVVWIDVVPLVWKTVAYPKTIFIGLVDGNNPAVGQK